MIFAAKRLATEAIPADTAYEKTNVVHIPKVLQVSTHVSKCDVLWGRVHICAKRVDCREAQRSTRELAELAAAVS